MKNLVRIIFIAVSLGAQINLFAQNGNEKKAPPSSGGSCSVPIGLYTTNKTTTSAKVRWNYNTNANSYTVQWRKSGTYSWSTGSASSNYRTLSGLTPSATYQWRVSATCISGGGGSGSIQRSKQTESATSSYSGIVTFTTTGDIPSCLSPDGLSTSNIGVNSATLNWQEVFAFGNTENLVSFTVNWRKVGTATWNAGTTSMTSKSIASLAGVTTYEWKVKKGCSEFSNTVQFTTASCMNLALSVTNISTSGATMHFYDQVPLSTNANPGNSVSYAIYWRKEGVATWSQTTISSGLINPSYGLSGLADHTTYECRVKTDCSNYSNIKQFTTLKDANYVRTFTAQKKNLNLIDFSEDNFEKEKILQSTVYFDGLGRSIQSVSRQISPLGFDVVQPINYDEFGRQPRDYLPYVDSKQSGIYKIDALLPNTYQSSSQYLFYQQANRKVAIDTKPYAQKIFEASPLNRVLEQGGPGTAWQPQTGNSNGKTIKLRYETNQANIVRLWTIVISGLPKTTSYYPVSKLYKHVTEDEEGAEVKEYTDKLGRTVLKKVQGDGSTWLETYYVYDDFGNLRFVVPPKASKLIGTSYTPTAGESILKNLIFQYRYDERQRMIMKKVPGAAPVYMVYDQRDRLVLTQDGNQYTGKKWNYTKYDVFNRPVMSGETTIATGFSTDRMAYRNAINNAVKSFYTTHPYYEIYIGSGQFGYSNNSYPSATGDVNSVTYYDNYNFKTQVFSGQNYNFNAEAGVASVDQSNAVKGLATGSKIRILGENTWLNSITYYDNRYRAIQVITDNHTGGFDRITSNYDFVGKVLNTLHTNKKDNAATAITIAQRFAYDHAGRSLKSYHKINSDSEVLLADNHYNELGELIEKNIGNGLQSIDYRYNIRGWLTHINNATRSNDGNTNDDTNDFFGMELGYNENLSSITGTPAFNGNISAVKWSRFEGNTNESAYTYTYDRLNRIKGADYRKKTTTAWSNVNDFDLTGMNYDENGNILNLTRKGENGASMDVLTYNYGSGTAASNQLQYVNDSGNAEGFDNGHTGSGDYSYDNNGNLTKDLNKDITAIEYNALNLPQKVTFANGDKIEYTYDAGGNKLAQKVTKDGTQIKHREYVAGYHYEESELKFIQHAEGRIVHIPEPVAGSTSWEYQYNLTDHLGNVRVTFTSSTTTNKIGADMEDNNTTAESEFGKSYKEGTRISSKVFNHTSEAGADKSLRLSGAQGEIIGMAKSLKVQPGDTISMEVFAKYTQPNGRSKASDVAGFIASAFTGSFGIGSGVDGKVNENYDFFSELFSAGPIFNSKDDGVPNAHINYLLFDDNYVLQDAGFQSISTAAREVGNNSPHEKLNLQAIAQKAGYIYIYLSNESSKLSDVYFDDMTITQTLSPIISAEDYYPFGLSFNQQTRENTQAQNYKFNQGTGKKQFKTERITDLDLNMDMTKFRMYDYTLGRFTSVDPLADITPQENWTPYQYAYNNPIRYNDPYGDCPTCFSGAVIGILTEVTAQVGYNLLIEGQNFGEALSNVDKTDVAVAGAIGFVTGALDGGVSNFAKFVSKRRNRKVLTKILKKGIDVLAETAENVAKDHFNGQEFNFGASLVGALAEVGLGSALPSSKFVKRQIKNSSKDIKRLSKKIGKGKNVTRNTKKLSSAKNTNKTFSSIQNAAKIGVGAAAENVGNAAGEKVIMLKPVIVRPTR